MSLGGRKIPHMSIMSVKIFYFLCNKRNLNLKCQGDPIRALAYPTTKAIITFKLKTLHAEIFRFCSKLTST